MIATSLRIALENNPELFSFIIKKDIIFVLEDNGRPIPIMKLPHEYIKISHLLKVKSWKIDNDNIELKIYDSKSSSTMDLFSREKMSLLFGPKTSVQL